MFVEVGTGVGVATIVGVIVGKDSAIGSGVGDSVGFVAWGVGVGEGMDDGVTDGVGSSAVAVVTGVGDGSKTLPCVGETVKTAVYVGEGSDGPPGVGLGEGASTLVEQADISALAVKPDITTTTRSSALAFTPASIRRTYNQLLLRFDAVWTES